MLYVIEALPAYSMVDPSNKLVLQWYYMLYHNHKNNCTKLMLASKKLNTKMIETVTKFFQVLFTQKKLSGMLKHHEI